MKLGKYRSKRDLKRSLEPKGKVHKRKNELRFVIQKHDARRLHYDLRLEAEGVLKSWAVPKGPSLNPNEKRLAIMVEDHPYDYQYFEGIIPEGYGAGSVEIWDSGTYNVDGKSSAESEKLVLEGLKKGEFHFSLEGEKCHGQFSLIRLKKSKKDEWLLIKKRDNFSQTTPLIEDQIEKAPKKKMPHRVSPMLATLIEEPFDDKDWIFEIKWDGFRAIAEIAKKKVELYSRNFLSFNEQFKIIVEQLKQLNIDAVFDGEIVILDKNGKPSFQSLQNYQNIESQRIYYYVFDLLYLNGKDLQKLPLIERKAKLWKVLKHAKDRIRYCDHIEEHGKKFFETCVNNDMEGIIGKKKLSPYTQETRTKNWVKIKKDVRQEAIICGYTEPKGGRKNIGALILGVYKGKRLHYIGHVGGGFTTKELERLKQLFKPYEQKESPFKTKIKTNTQVTWLKPHFLCEVAFTEWTQEGQMRHPIYKGLREDKTPKTVKKEIPKKREAVVKKQVHLTNLEKVYWPKEALTKGDMINYYDEISDFILPYLKDRPQSLRRYPDGIDGESFFQKNIKDYPPWVSTTKIEHSNKSVNYLLIQNKESLLFAANLGCIELHPFFSRIQSLNNPDFLVFDLDPVDISFNAVIETATTLHEILEDLNITSFCKTSGARGLHILIPLHAKYSYEITTQFAAIIAHILNQRIPNITSLERAIKKRRKKVYIDYHQNNFGQTLAAPYSLRAKEGAPVSTPLDWKEVKKGLDPLDFNIHTIHSRIKKKGDLLKPLLGKGVDLMKALQQLSI